LRYPQLVAPDLRHSTQAGGKLEADLCAEVADTYERQGRRFYAMYGQTEATARIAYLPWADARAKAGSIGRAIPGGRLWLEDPSGTVITEPDRVGELMYAGDNVSLGYAEHYTDLAKGDEFGGVLRTGDLAVCDRDGYYSIVGRLKRFIKLFGSRVSLDELEQLVRTAGFECACTGQDDKLTIHVVGCGVADLVANHVADQTGIHRSAIAVIEVAQIPVGASGKVQYAALD
jgi:acyl-coenzyme A synthetase/AMP-(fatty) acid ligase